jgi:glycerol-3-phosphate dehydrogenase
MNQFYYDMVIIGGGIAGLWTLASAREKGLNAILLEKSALGCGQTISSQGIIHGGSKYALAGSMSLATNMISDMPNTWINAIKGNSDIKLSNVEVLSDTQHLIPSSGIDTQLLSFLGSKTMASHTEKIGKKSLPAQYQTLGINRSIFRLNEIVLNIETLLKSFQDQYGDYIFQANVNENNIHSDANALYQHNIYIENSTIHCHYIVIACGENMTTFPKKTTVMQTRPLHMVMVKGKSLPAIYAHFIGRSTKPVITITSHPTSDHQTVWYLGGDLAENGVDKNENAQIDEAKKLLKKLTPKLDLSHELIFSTHRINRAEPAQNTLTRPDDAFINNNNNIISGWPTKLALAPRFAEKVLAETHTNIKSTQANRIDLILPHPSIATFPWHNL